MSQHIDPEVKQSFIVDNLTTNDSGKALSAAQGKALDDKITISNSKIDTINIGSKTLSALQTYLETLGESMADNTYKFIRFYNEVASSPFVASTAYFGQIFKFTTGRYEVTLQGAGSPLNTITGIYNSGWTWDSLNSNLPSNNGQHTIEKNTTTSAGTLTFTAVGRCGGIALIHQNSTDSSVYAFVIASNGTVTISKVIGRDVTITTETNTISFSVGNWSGITVISNATIY